MSTLNTAYIWIGGYPETPNPTDTINITFFNSALSGGQYTMPPYTVAWGDAGQPAQVATHLAAAINSNSTLGIAGISATASGTLVTLLGGSPFAARSNVSVGTNPTAIAITPNGSTAYVCNNGSATVTPITTSTNTAGTAISVGTNPAAIAITPNGSTAYVCNNGSGTVTPITTSTNTAGTAISVGTNPAAIAITPDGSTAYVCNNGSATVTPITTSTNTAGTAISVGTNPAAIAITPDGSTAYVCNNGSGTVTPITTSTNTAGTAITVGTNPAAIAITPNGSTAYVCNNGSGSVTPITTSTNTAGTAITVGTNPAAIAITPNGSTAYVCNNGSGTVTPITTSTNTAGTAITVGSKPTSIAITADGNFVFVANNGGTTVSAISTATNYVVATITAGTSPGQGLQGIACMPAGDAAYVSNYGSANVTPIVDAGVIASGTGSTTANVGGGGRLAQVTNSVIANSPITYSYDALGRTSTRMINGGNNSINWAYDPMSRITSEQNVLGTFNYTYVDDTSGSSKGTLRLASIAYPNSQTTNFSYLPNIGDQRLQQIANLNPSSATLSQFNYAYDSAGEITLWQQQQNANSEYHNLQYDLAGQLSTDLVGSGSAQSPYGKKFFYNYDRASNRNAVQTSSMQTAAIAGSVTAGDTITVTVNDIGLSGGTESATYTAQSGDTLSSIAAGLAAAISSDTNLVSLGVNAVSNSSSIFIRSTSPNITTYSTSTSSGATETITLRIYKNGTTNVLVGGTKTTSDVLTIKVIDPALTGGSQSVSYTVLSGDTLTSIATGLKSAINSNSSLSTLGVTATTAGPVVNISSASTNVTNYTTSLSSGSTEIMTVSPDLNSNETAVVGGSKTTGDTITLKVYDAGLSGGSESAGYTVLSGDTLTSIAAGLTSAVNADTSLQGIGVSATSSGTAITLQSNSINPTTYRRTFSSGATETLNLLVAVNGTQTGVIGGSKTTGDTVTITSYDPALSGGKEAVTYTVLSGDSLTSIASGLASAINADSNLSGIGVTATSVGTVVNLTSTSMNNTGYVGTTSSGATETISISNTTGVTQAAFNNVNELTAVSAGGAVRFQATTANPVTSAKVNVAQTATVGGTITAGDVVWLSVHDKGLSQAENVNYTVLSSDSTTSIATALKNAINADTTLSSLGVTATSSGAVVTISSSSVNVTAYTGAVSTGATETVTIGGTSGSVATVSPSIAFTANPVLGSGTNMAAVTAVSGGGTAATNVYPVQIPSTSSQSLTYDSNGNMTGDGTNTYAWDAENRLIKIIYPGTNNYSTFAYDGLGRRVQIAEYTGASATSTKNFIWCGNQICESRDSTISDNRQFFSQGETINTGTAVSYYYTKDHLGSIREMTNSGGAIQAQYGYDPFGQVTLLAGSNLADFQYAGYYEHQRSGLNFTKFRAYNSALGRWISRDPVGESSGINLYGYVSNIPTLFRDPLGLQGLLKGGVQTEEYVPLFNMPPTQLPAPNTYQINPIPSSEPGIYNPETPTPEPGSTPAPSPTGGPQGQGPAGPGGLMLPNMMNGPMLGPNPGPGGDNTNPMPAPNPSPSPSPSPNPNPSPIPNSNPIPNC